MGKCGSTLSACVITVGEESEDLTFQISLHFRTEVWFGNQVDDKLVGGLGVCASGEPRRLPPSGGDPHRHHHQPSGLVRYPGKWR